jgi:hypothetical protein
VGATRNSFCDFLYDNSFGCDLVRQFHGRVLQGHEETRNVIDRRDSHFTRFVEVPRSVACVRVTFDISPHLPEACRRRRRR